MIDFFLSPNVQSSTQKDFGHIQWLLIKMCNISPHKQAQVGLSVLSLWDVVLYILLKALNKIIKVDFQIVNQWPCHYDGKCI